MVSSTRIILVKDIEDKDDTTKRVLKEEFASVETPVETLYTSGQVSEPYKSADESAKFALRCCNNYFWKESAFFVIDNKHGTNAEKEKWLQFG